MKRLILALALMVATQAFANLYITGNKLNNWSISIDRIQAGNAKNEDYQAASTFHGYIWGVVDAYQDVLVCVPDNVQTGQLVALVQQYLKSHPEMWGDSAATIVHSALKPVFPCKK